MLGVGHGLLLFELLQLQGADVLHEFVGIGFGQTVVRVHQLRGERGKVGGAGVLQCYAQGAPGLIAVFDVLGFKPRKKCAVRPRLANEDVVLCGAECIPRLDAA